MWKGCETSKYEVHKYGRSSTKAFTLGLIIDFSKRNTTAGTMNEYAYENNRWTMKNYYSGKNRYLRLKYKPQICRLKNQ